MNITDKINFRQPKYVLPAIVYLPLLFTGYFVCDFFNLKPVETSKMETTNYYNDKLPSANIKGDGIGQKYQNMVENFGKIKDGSAVENIEGRTEKEKEKYDEKKLCRVMGWGMAVIAILTLIMAAGCQVLPAAFADLYGAVVLIDCLVMIVLGNTICKK